MGFADSVANDYKITDDTETVTFRDVSASLNITVTYADGHEFSSQEVAAGGGLFGMGDRAWALGCNQIPTTNQPAPGDTITQANGTVWEILDSRRDDFEISWICTTRKAR